MTAPEIRAALRPLLRAAFAHGTGSRPRRYQPDPEVLQELRRLASEPVVHDTAAEGEWRVVEGRRWLLNRRLDGRSVPLVRREHVAVVARSWEEARDVASLLNWCDAPTPPRGGLGAPAHVAARIR